MKLYTRTGDTGHTALFGGGRVSKTDPRVEAYGQVDELNAVIGWALAACQPGRDDVIASKLSALQSDLFEVGADLATPASSPGRCRINPINADDVARLEAWIDQACQPTPPMRSFILPGGTELASRLHVARTVSRRTERRIVHLLREHQAPVTESEHEPIGMAVVAYMNRISDLLFALARLANHLAGVADVPWTPRPAPPER